MRWLASSVVLAALVGLGCVSHSNLANSRITVVDRQFFSQCPFGVPQPSLTLVTDRLKWQQILASARTAPPPFDASATTFDTNSVIIVATRATATPHTRLSIKDDAIALNPGARSLQLDIEVADVRPALGEIELTVVGMPCLVVWTSRVLAVDRIEARDAVTGELLTEAHKP